jgi:hypothetical protein
MGRTTIADPDGEYIGLEAALDLADGMVRPSYFRRVRRGAPIRRLEP